MAVEQHIVELNGKHQRLDNALTEEMQRPSRDWLKVTELKKQKLRLKEEMERLKKSE